MKIVLLSVILFCFPYEVLSQGFKNNWLLGYATGLDQYTTSLRATINFTGGFPSVLPSSFKMRFSATQGNISDLNGNLLMSSNGNWIADATGDTMLNGNDINPGPFVNNSTYGSPILNGNFFLPWPGDSTKYVLFHQTGNFSLGALSSELFYSKIDLTLNNGLGEVILKNQIAFSDTLSWGLGACKHANGRDWWIIAVKDNSNKLFKVLLTPNGIISVTSQSFPSKISESGTACEPVFSPDGNKLAFSTGYWIGGPAPWVTHLNYFDFDRCTGIFSNHQTIDITDGSLGSGTAFSPNSKYLYASTTQRIFQLNTDSFPLVADTVATYDGFQSANFSTVFYIMYLANDNRIYITSGNGSVHIHYINFPDSGGISCDVQQHALQVPCYYLRSVPHHPNYFLGPVIGSICDSISIGVSEVTHDFKLNIFPNPTNGNFSVSYFLPENKGGQFEVYDLMGRKIYAKPLQPWSTFQKISLTDTPNGFFQCVIKSGKFVYSKKLVIME